MVRRLEVYLVSLDMAVTHWLHSSTKENQGSLRIGRDSRDWMIYSSSGLAYTGVRHWLPCLVSSREGSGYPTLISTNPWYLIPLNYLSRSLMDGPHLALCKSEKEFLSEMKRLNIKDHGVWLLTGTDACTHSFFSKGRLVCLITIDMVYARKYSKIEIAGLLCHEAVHVWQRFKEHIHERDPSREQEAYAIQNIAQNLMEEFYRNPKPLKRKKKRWRRPS